MFTPTEPVSIRRAMRNAASSSPPKTMPPRPIAVSLAMSTAPSTSSARRIDGYAETASSRIWKAQHFSWWMTSMLHVQPGADAFDRRRQLGELRSVVESEAGRTYLAEAYTGWPLA